MRGMPAQAWPKFDDSILVHRHSEISFDAVIGHRTKVWQFASVIRGAVLGADCSVGACAVVDSAVVGDRCRIGAGAQLHPGTHIQNDVFVGPGSIFCNDRWPRTGNEIFPMEALMSGDEITVIVRDNASVGAGAIILPGVVIGKSAMVAAGAVVSEDVPAGHLYKRTGAIVKIDERAFEVLRRAV